MKKKKLRKRWGKQKMGVEGEEEEEKKMVIEMVEKMGDEGEEEDEKKTKGKKKDGGKDG